MTEWFQTVVGVLQGDVLSSLLFLIFLEITITVSVEDIDVGAWINGKRMTDLRFADDIAVLAENVTDLQEAVDRISIASTRMGMQINTSKTETQFLGKGDKCFDIQVNGQCLHQTERFMYLGGTISSKD